MRSSFRKMSPGIWSSPGEASIHGHIDLDLETYFARFPEMEKRSPLPLLLFLMSATMSQTPELRQVLTWKSVWKSREWSFVLPIDSLEKDLRFLRIEPGANWVLADYQKYFESNHKELRQDGIKQLGWAFHFLDWVPALFIPFAMGFVSFCLYELSLPPRWFGFRKDPFGPIVVSNFGSLGLLEGYAPLVPICRNAMTVGVGKMRLKPLVIDGELKLRRCLPISATIDHRYLDGAHCAQIFEDLQKALNEISR